jgi:predicted alpha-1,2-mannosidase
MVRSMLGMFEESGELPKWELNANETHIMVGDPAAAVIADTWMKGLRGFDAELAWQAISASAFPLPDGKNPVTRPGLAAYLKHGYIPNDAKGPDWVWGSVATTLEYAVADFAAAQFAREIGKTTEADDLTRRALFYRNLYDKETGFLRPRLADGTWFEPFDPLNRYGEFEGNKSPIGGPGYVEGHAWHYTFFVPHDIPGYAALARPDKFAAKLEQCFAERHYDPSNEPDIAYPFAFNRLPGHEVRASHWVRDILDTYYGEGPGGLPGNDDCGTLSAWLVFAMLGLYPDIPGLPEYSLVAPRFPEAKLRLENPPCAGGPVTIRRTGNPDPAAPIARILWNGKALERPFLPHADLQKGGTLVIDMK